MITRLLEALFTWISGVISAMGYPGVALLMAIESCCIPLPSEMIMPLAGWLVATGRFTLWGIALARAIGRVGGSSPPSYAGLYGARAPACHPAGGHLVRTPHPHRHEES